MASNRRMRLIAIALAVVAVGVVSIATAHARWQVASWTGDLLTGLVMAGAGLVAMVRAKTSRIGALLVIAGIAWFIGDYAVLGGAPGWIAGVLMFVHRGVLFHAIMTVPSGRLSSRFQWIAVVIGYAVSLVPWVWTNAIPAIVASLAAVAATVVELSGAQGVRRRSKRRALEAVALVATATAAAFAIRAIAVSWLGVTTALIAYELAVCGAAGLLVLAAQTVRRPAEVADMVIELDEGGGADLEAALRRELGDPGLTLAYADADPATGPIDAASAARQTVLIGLHGGRCAILDVDDESLADPALRESVAAAIRLDDANRSLRRDVAQQVEAVRASRTRLIRAADDAGRELEERLHSGAGERLAELEALLDRCGTREPGSALEGPLATAQSLLVDTRDDLERFSAGLHPRTLDELGLAGALGAAVQQSAISTDLEVVENAPVPPDIQLAAYFFCLEGLVNIAKHASAARASVRVVAVDGELNLEVADDGIGGATPGSGIQGIADRIAALGGVLTLESGRGAGTRLVGRVPLEESSAYARPAVAP